MLSDLRFAGFILSVLLVAGLGVVVYWQVRFRGPERVEEAVERPARRRGGRHRPNAQ
jgi:hypothetical protein